MTRRMSIVLPVAGVVGAGLVCGHYIWKRTAERGRRRNTSGPARRGLTGRSPIARAAWAVGESEVFNNLRFLPH